VRSFCFVIFSVQIFHDAFGGITCTCWFLSKAGIELKHPGNARFELQVVDIPHGQEDIAGARIFCSACSLFCMQLHCERQFYFIFLGERQFYFLFFLGEHEFWKKINSMWFLSLQK
jgi:hypothetical protein